MKRNKPIIKRRKAGTQYLRRRNAGYMYGDDRSAGGWLLLLPQGLGGADIRHITLDNLTPLGRDGETENPAMSHHLYRWRVDTDGKSFVAYTASYWWDTHGNSEGQEATWFAYTGRGKCTQGRNCPGVRRTYTPWSGVEVSFHPPSRCPYAVQNIRTWKLERQIVPRPTYW